MRILQINNYNFIKGGADRVYFNTIKLLEDNNHVVADFSTLNPLNVDSLYTKYFIPLDDYRHKGIIGKIAGVKNYLYNSTSYRNLKKLIEDFRPDIAHIHLFYGGLTSSILKVLKEYNIPIVQSVHDYRILCPANAFLDNKSRICEKCKNKFFVQCSFDRCLESNFFFSSILTLEAYTRKYLLDPLEFIDHYIFVSRFSQAKHIEYDNRFSGKSSHLYNFTFISDTYSIRNNKSYFLFFGRLSKEKGLMTLLEAMKSLDVNLKIAGTGPLQAEVEKYALSNKNVEYLYNKSGQELEELIADASFIIVPSEWYENNPMTILEAYAIGKPVIGADIGGIPEILVNNKTGFLFKSRSVDDLKMAIRNAASLSDSEYLNYARFARKFAEENFAPQGHYTKLMEVYANILNR